jgi:hypothetical protein
MSVHVMHFSVPKRAVVTWGEVDKWIREELKY